MSTGLTRPRPDLPLVPQRGPGQRLRRRRDRVLRPWAAPVPPPRRPALAGKAFAALVVLAAIAVLLPVSLWARYRMAWVVSHNAQVRGPITHVGAQLPGVVKMVEVDVGQRATAGQVLARFEDHQLRASVLRAQSRVAEATARAASAEAQIAAARTQAEEAAVRHDQQVALVRTGAIPRNDLLTAETQQRTTQALQAVAVADRRAATAEVEAARAELALARADLAAAVVRAPSDGWVVRRIAEPGASLVVGQPIVDLWIGDQVWVEAWINEDQLGSVTVGTPAQVRVKPYGNRDLTGVVESIGVSTDAELPETTVPQPRTARMRSTPVVCVRIRLQGAERLFPGLSAVVAIRKTSPR
ncbi:MAG TPA: efflux RND transporter periplasmic adaptor subunit [Candidatus Eisenbacteria bacterium]|nr:efflux RND transporter periplasmic adaptor subunit [Candidatus Eisenbacteria bacterium]